MTKSYNQEAQEMVERVEGNIQKPAETAQEKSERNFYNFARALKNCKHFYTHLSAFIQEQIDFILEQAKKEKKLNDLYSQIIEASEEILPTEVTIKDRKKVSFDLVNDHHQVFEVDDTLQVTHPSQIQNLPINFRHLKSISSHCPNPQVNSTIEFSETKSLLHENYEERMEIIQELKKLKEQQIFRMISFDGSAEDFARLVQLLGTLNKIIERSLFFQRASDSRMIFEESAEFLIQIRGNFDSWLTSLLKGEVDKRQIEKAGEDFLTFKKAIDDALPTITTFFEDNCELSKKSIDSLKKRAQDKTDINDEDKPTKAIKKGRKRVQK